MGTDTIRQPGADERDAILAVVMAAFSSPERAGDEEVDIVKAIWSRDAVTEGLELVALDDGRVVGHVAASTGVLGDHPVAGVAPLSVAPSHQGQGVGSALMRELIRRADAAGLPMLLILGSDHYYGRFGFEPAGAHGIVYPPVGPDSPHFQVLRLSAFEPGLTGEYSYAWELPREPPGRSR